MEPARDRRGRPHADRQLPRDGRLVAALCAVLDALRRLVADIPTSRRADVLGSPSTYGELAGLIPELGPGREWHESVEIMPIDSRQSRLFDQIVGLLERAAARAPLVLAIDDLHWADQSTLDLITYIVNTIDGVGVVLILTYRQDELTRRHPLRPLLTRLQRSDNVTSINLRALDRGELAALVSAIPASRRQRRCSTTSKRAARATRSSPRSCWQRPTPTTMRSRWRCRRACWHVWTGCPRTRRRSSA
jgi:hypothetical protein